MRDEWARQDARRLQQIGMTDRARFERWQGLLRDACEALGPMRLTGEMGETFLAALRGALLRAGATEREIDSVAAWLATWVVQETHPSSEKRREAVASIAHHLAETDIRVRFSPDAQHVRVEFPARPAVH